MSEPERKKILVVDDEPSITKLCRRILEKAGYDVSTVDNGKDAEYAVDETNYDLLLVDVILPVESGTDFYIWLLQEHRDVSRRVIFTTGSSLGGDIMDILNRFDRPYILKPFRPNELLAVINDFFTAA